MKSYLNINYGICNHPNQVLDIHLPDCDHFPVFVYFHGGALEVGDKKHDGLAKTLTDQGIAFITANYRMYPHAAYPDFIRDAASVVAWVKKNIENYGNCDGIFVGGSSAGAYLSMMLCFDKRWLGAHIMNNIEVVDGYIHDAGQPTCHFNILARERNIHRNRVMIDETAALWHVGVDPEYSPMLFLVADDDMENRYEQTMLMLSTLKHYRYDQSKIDLKVMHGKHVCYVDQYDEQGNNVFGMIVAEFTKKHQH